MTIIAFLGSESNTDFDPMWLIIGFAWVLFVGLCIFGWLYMTKSIYKKVSEKNYLSSSKVALTAAEYKKKNRTKSILQTLLIVGLISSPYWFFSVIGGIVDKVQDERKEKEYKECIEKYPQPTPPTFMSPGVVNKDGKTYAQLQEEYRTVYDNSNYAKYCHPIKF